MNACRNTLIIMAAGFAVLCGCAEKDLPAVVPSHKNFHIQLPLTFDSRGIVMPTYWGKEKSALMLNLDNHSPTWVNNTVITGNNAIKKSKDFLYRTTTADGVSISGNVYVCDSLRIGSIAFKNIALYNISNHENTERPDGVIGENIMREGIWKIDFKNRLLEFASSADSIKGWADGVILPANFTDNAIEVMASFGHGAKQKLELDLGYNGFIIVPAASFASITNGNHSIQKETMRFSTPAGTTIVENSIAADSSCIGQHCMGTLITTNHLVKEPLLGLRFFSCFAFMILDYPHQLIYVSKERMPVTAEAK